MVIGYRADIDGLRSVAVLGVLLYHVHLPYISGGFTGVDVFFVISGYLITSIIITELHQGRFSLVNFYERRLRRIVPALVFCVAGTLMAGYAFLVPDDLANLGESALASVLFASNIYFFLKTGYFDGPASLMPLLHTWSLGVEEQFYLFWPLLLFGLFWLRSRMAAPATIGVLGVLFATSFAAAFAITATDPSLAFYMLPFRAWEFGLGALIAVAPASWTVAFERRAVSVPAGILGFAGIGLAFFWIDRETPFPGAYALLPAAGAALVILAGRDGGNLVARLLASAIPVWIGKISYSLYLWHWPIVVYFAIYTGGQNPTATEIALLLVGSMVAAAISFYLVERPLRHARLKAIGLTSAGGTLVAGCLASALVVTGGFNSRIGDARTEFTKEAMWEFECPQTVALEDLGDEDHCVVGADWQTATRKVLLWGDSHAMHFAPLIDRIAARKGISVVQSGGSCPAYLDNVRVKRWYRNSHEYSRDCGERREQVLKWLEANPDVGLVVIAAAWSGYLESIYDEDHTKITREASVRLTREATERLTNDLRAIGVDVLLLGDVPRPQKDLVGCALKVERLVYRRAPSELCDGLPVGYVNGFQADVNRVLRHLHAPERGVHSIIMTDTMCGTDICPLYVDGTFIYRDSNHLRRNLDAQTMESLIKLMKLEGLYDWSF